MRLVPDVARTEHLMESDSLLLEVANESSPGIWIRVQSVENSLKME
jgi:hypothetical protein